MLWEKFNKEVKEMVQRQLRVKISVIIMAHTSKFEMRIVNKEHQFKPSLNCENAD